MAKDLLVVSLGRIVADQVRVDATEAYAVLQHVWQRIRASRDDDGAVVGLPHQDAMGITAFGDFEVRATPAPAARSVRPPHVLTQELSALLQRLVASGRPDLASAPRACVDALQRASPGANPTARPIVTPEALFRALEAFRPRDPSAALAALYARWMRTTDGTQAGSRPSVLAAPPVAAGAVAAPRVALSLALPRSGDAAVPTPEPPVGRGDHGHPGADLPLRLSLGEVVASPVAPPRASLRAAARTPVRMPVALVPPVLTRPEPPAPAAAGGAGRRVGSAIAAMICVVLLGGVGAWRWVMAEDTGIVVDEQVITESRDTAVGSPTADGLAGAAHPGDEPGSLRAGAPARVDRPRVRRLLHADASGRVPWSPSFDPRRNSLVFHAGIDRTALLEASLRGDGTVGEVSTVREDDASSYHVQVSPDGNQLAYDSDAEGERAVYVSHRDGSSPRRVSGPGHASVPSWSPDGASLAFARAETDRPEVWNVWTVHLATGKLERQTNHSEGRPWGASWFPDGRRIAYNHEDRLLVRDLDTGALRAYPTPVPGRQVRTPAVSPDGTHIVFQVRHDGAWVLDLRSGSSRRILADASAQEFAWSPDGRHVAYHSVRGGQWGIWMLDLAPETGP